MFDAWSKKNYLIDITINYTGRNFKNERNNHYSNKNNSDHRS